MDLTSAKKAIPFGILIIAVILVGILGYFIWNNTIRYSNLPKISAKDLGITEDSKLRKVNPQVYYTGAEANPQNAAQVYVNKNNPVAKLNEEEAKGMAASFGFSGTGKKLGDLMIWQDPTKSFIANIPGQTISFSADSLLPELVGKDSLPNKEEAAVQTKEILGKLGIPQSVIDFSGAAVSYSNLSATEASLKSNSKVRVAIFDYHFKVSNSLIYGEKGNQLDFKIQLAKGSKLAGFSTSWHQFSWEKPETYPLKSIDESVKEIAAGAGVITQLTTLQTASLTQKNKNISVINLSDFKLGYLPVISQQTYLLPIHIFTGKAVLKSGEVDNITIYNSALPKRFIAN
jgi:hypothetical protein